jgi:hypothetical protein
MIEFDSFESNLENVIYDGTKMKLFSQYIYSISDSKINGGAMDILLNSLSSPDKVMFAVYYHDLTDLQRSIVTAALKILNVTDNQKEFESRMNTAIPKITKDYQ